MTTSRICFVLRLQLEVFSGEYEAQYRVQHTAMNSNTYVLVLGSHPSKYVPFRIPTFDSNLFRRAVFGLTEYRTFLPSKHITQIEDQPALAIPFHTPQQKTRV